MKTTIFTLFTVAVFATTSALTSNAAIQVYDLKTDWSDTQNPNDVWSYLLNGSLAPSGTRGGDPFGTPPPIWGDPGSPWVGWSKSNGSELFDHDWIAGDVFGHMGSLQIRWTSPTAGSIDVTGDVWPTRDIGRFTDWFLTLNGNPLASGVVGSGDPYSRSSPLSFTALNLAVNCGDILEFSASVSSGSISDYIAVNLTVNLSSDVGDPCDETSPVIWTGNCHYYEFVPEILTWEEARAAALSRTHLGVSGHLVTITSAGENAFINAAFNTGIGNRGTWIGGYEPADDGVWRWADGPEAGVQFSYFANPTPPFNYVSWGEFEPNDGRPPDERYAWMNIGAPFPGVGSSEWADSIPLSNPLDPVVGYIVEYSPPDTDGDGIPDTCDSCPTVPQTLTVYNLSRDWSDVNNPFGPWKLWKSQTDIFAISQDDFDGSGANAWADDPFPQLKHVPVWWRLLGASAILPAAGSYAPCDILVHGAEFDRTGANVTSVRWTAPAAGAAEIAGKVWTIGTLGRSQKFVLRKNGIDLSEATLTSDGITHLAANPLGIEQFSAGAQATHQQVVAGDELELAVITLSEDGNLGDSMFLQLEIKLLSCEPISNNAPPSPCEQSDATPPCVPLPAGLVAWWPGNGSANDVVGGNHGTVIGDVTFAPGVCGLAFDLRGSGYVNVPEAAAFDFGPQDSFTAMAWVYRTGTGIPTHFFGKRVGCGGGGFYQTAIGPGALAEADVPLQQWTLVAITYDRCTDTITQWANDQARSTIALAVEPQNDADFKIGNSGDCEPFDGLLYNMMIFNRVITQTEMSLLYSQGCNAVCLLQSHDTPCGDTLAPTISCPPAVSVQCIANVPPADFAGGSVSDDQDPNPTVTHEGDTTSGSCPQTIVRTYKATDDRGNMATCTQTITVNDTTAPVITCPPAVSITAGSDPSAATSASAFRAQGGTIADNCDPDPMVTSSDSTQGDCIQVITRTYTVTDACGNASACQQIITVTKLFAADAIIWHQPLARNGASEDTDPSAGRTVKYRFKRGSTIPIQIHALGCTGDVTSNANVIGAVTVFGDSNCEGATDANAEPIEFNGVGGSGGVMDKIGGHLKYNLDTKSLPTTTQCYILRVTVTDTSTGEETYEEVLLQAK